jgi:RNA polymerase sigma factor (sigma-70 family)
VGRRQAKGDGMGIRQNCSANDTVTALVIRYSDGDRSAFAPLFALVWPIVLKYCNRALMDEKDAEDAAQEGLLKVFSRIADFDRQRDGLAWILGIASFEIKTIRKRKMRRREGNCDCLLSTPSTEESAEYAAAERQMRAVVPAAIGQLSPQDQAIVQEILQDSPSTNPIGPLERKRKQRAIERLRVAWRRFYVG